MAEHLTTAQRAARGQHANAVPDYVEMATVVVEMVYNTPRKEFTREHHRAVDVILKRWAEARQAA